MQRHLFARISVIFVFLIIKLYLVLKMRLNKDEITFIVEYELMPSDGTDTNSLIIIDG